MSWRLIVFLVFYVLRNSSSGNDHRKARLLQYAQLLSGFIKLLPSTSIICLCIKNIETTNKCELHKVVGHKQIEQTDFHILKTHEMLHWEFWWTSCTTNTPQLMFCSLNSKSIRSFEEEEKGRRRKISKQRRSFNFSTSALNDCRDAFRCWERRRQEWSVSGNILYSYKTNPKVNLIWKEHELSEAWHRTQWAAFLGCLIQ